MAPAASPAVGPAPAAAAAYAATQAVPPSTEARRAERYANLVTAWEALCNAQEWDSVADVQRDLIVDFGLSAQNFDYENCRVVAAPARAAAPATGQVALVNAPAAVATAPAQQAALPPPATGPVPLAKAPPGTPQRVPLALQGRFSMGRSVFW